MIFFHFIYIHYLRWNTTDFRLEAKSLKSLISSRSCGSTEACRYNNDA